MSLFAFLNHFEVADNVDTSALADSEQGMHVILRRVIHASLCQATSIHSIIEEFRSAVSSFEARLAEIGKQRTVKDQGY